MKTSKYIYFILWIVMASLGLAWYINNATACAYAQGVMAYHKSIRGSISTTTDYYPLSLFWRPTEGDYKACKLVGEEL